MGSSKEEGPSFPADTDEKLDREYAMTTNSSTEADTDNHSKEHGPTLSKETFEAAEPDTEPDPDEIEVAVPGHELDIELGKVRWRRAISWRWGPVLGRLPYPYAWEGTAKQTLLPYPRGRVHCEQKKSWLTCLVADSRYRGAQKDRVSW